MTALPTAVAASIALAAAAPAAAQTRTVPPVPPAALEKLLPAVDGWTSAPPRAMAVDVSADAKYTLASVVLTRDDARVKLQLSDTGFSSECLLALAAMVVSLPEDYAGDVGGAAMKRLLVQGWPAVESWDAQKRAGEIVVIVGGRFVVSVEASKADGLDTLRGLLGKVDLKALAAQKDAARQGRIAIVRMTGGVTGRLGSPSRPGLGPRGRRPGS